MRANASLKHEFVEFIPEELEQGTLYISIRFKTGTLLGQAFIALGLATPQAPAQSGESPQRRVERLLYEAGSAVNALRNKSGTGHGRPFVPSVPDDEAIAALQLIGIVSGLLLRALKKTP